MSIKITSRGKGKSAVAAAAYRAGEKITNEYDGITHDYTRKGGVAHKEILLPENAPAAYAGRATLWNAVEKIEKFKDSQLAREIELALPVELSREENIALVRDYCQRHFVAAGMCADICIHDKNDGNPHAHVLLTMRAFEQDGSWAAKCRKEYFYDENGEKILLKSGEPKSRKVNATDWNDRGKAEVWREGWAEAVNAAMERAGHAERIDHRSYERQGVEQIPTVHLGVVASAMEKRGIRTERGDINREIEVTNQRLRQLKARITKLQNWLDEETASTAPPTLADVIEGILSRREQSGNAGRYQAIGNLKAAAKMLNFLTANGIQDMAGLSDYVTNLHKKQFAIRDKLKPIERRVKTLDEHLRHSENFKAYRGRKAQYEKLHAQYRAIKKAGGFGAERKAKKALDAANAYHDANHTEIARFEAAEQHLKNVMQGHFDPAKLPPITKWTAERAKLIAEGKPLNRDYLLLKDEVKEVEQIRKNVDSILRQEQREHQPRRAQDIEL